MRCIRCYSYPVCCFLSLFFLFSCLGPCERNPFHLSLWLICSHQEQTYFILQATIRCVRGSPTIPSHLGRSLPVTARSPARWCWLIMSLVYFPPGPLLHLFLTFSIYPKASCFAGTCSWGCCCFPAILPLGSLGPRLWSTTGHLVVEESLRWATPLDKYSTTQTHPSDCHGN